MPRRPAAARPHRIALNLATTAVAALLLASCVSPSQDPDRGASSADARPMGHIHAVASDPGSGDVLLATHGGLFRLGPSGTTPVGPAVDLMGFAVAPDGAYLASGHPGPGTDLDQPVGLIRSEDGGQSWSAVSRAGKSDFHTLTVGPGVVAGFDGALRVGTDGSSWQQRPIPAPPRTLSASPSGDRLLATTEQGLLSSEDQGRAWAPVATPDLLVTVAWADADTLVGVSVTGTLVISEDAGGTWTAGGSVGQASAVSATRTADGLDVLLVVGETVVRTTDRGETLERVA